MVEIREVLKKHERNNARFSGTDNLYSKSHKHRKLVTHSIKHVTAMTNHIKFLENTKGTHLNDEQESFFINIITFLKSTNFWFRT